LAALAIEGHEAELIEHEQLAACEATLELAELTTALRLDECPDEVGGAVPGNAASLSSDLDAEGRREVGLPGPHRPNEDDVLLLVDERAARQREHLCLVDADGQREVEGVDGEQIGKARLADPEEH